MSRIENLANAGLVTKTGLVGNETAEAWTAEEMLANQTITKTGLDPNEVEKEANGPVATPTFTYDADTSKLTISCVTEEATIKYQVGEASPVEYEEPIDVTDIAALKAWGEKTDFQDSMIANWTKPTGE